MTKRCTKFKRNPRDYYITPFHAVVPLIPHLDEDYYMEPCAGDGSLVKHLDRFGKICTSASDIEPQHPTVYQKNAFELTELMYGAKCIVSNTPWDRKLLHLMIDHFRQLGPTWLLFDSDWMFTKQAGGYHQPTNYLEYCHKIVSVGRVRWFNNQSGKDNCAWYYFKNEPGHTEFFGPKIETSEMGKR